MYRSSISGGLGVHNVKLKALAGLIRSFLETACHPKFQSSLYHAVLYRYHILDEITLPNPGYPPFYNADFFATIRSVHRDSPLNVATMSEKQWYTVLLEDRCTMEQLDGGLRKFIPCNAEKKSPSTNWEECWRKARLPGLGPENLSLIFRMLHNTLVTQERLAKTSPTTSPLCKFPGCPGTEKEDLVHALVSCAGNNGTGTSLYNCLEKFVPGLKLDEALRLDFHVEEHLELPLVWVMAVAWNAIWDLRTKKTKPTIYLVRAQLEPKVALLREGRRFKNTCVIIDTIIETL